MIVPSETECRRRRAAVAFVVLPRYNDGGGACCFAHIVVNFNLPTFGAGAWRQKPRESERARAVKRTEFEIVGLCGIVNRLADRFSETRGMKGADVIDESVFE